MLPLVRLGDLCSGHGCFPPRPAITASQNVYCNGLPVHRVGDRWDTHCCGNECHDGVLVTGSNKVFVNGKALARVEDAISCGSYAAQGSPNVYCKE